MVEAISYLTIGVVAYLFAALLKNWEAGVVSALLVHVTWIGFFDFGTLVTPYATFVWYTTIALLWALNGFTFATLWQAPPLLHAGFLQRAFKGLTGQGKDVKDAGGVARVSAITLIFVVFVGLAHLVYELDVSGFSKPWGGIIMLIALAILYLVFYVAIRGEKLIFKSGDNGEALTYVFWLAIPHIVFALVYVILDAVLSDAVFFGDEWNFYISLIVFGFFLILLFLIGAGFLRTNSNYQVVTQNP